jgi:hypothetical protein
MTKLSKKLNKKQEEELILLLEERFIKNKNRHKNVEWNEVRTKLLKSPSKLYSIFLMEQNGGEPDVTGFDKKTGEFWFMDCSTESPAGRRSLCYDEEALTARKENKPKGSALGIAFEMGIELLNEEQYMYLQSLGQFDCKTSSWLLTPVEVRNNGGAVFGDYRYGRVFIYHNGVQSYYAARGFRGLLKV